MHNSLEGFRRIGSGRTNTGMSEPYLNADLTKPVWKDLDVSSDVEAMLEVHAKVSRDVDSIILPPNIAVTPDSPPQIL